MLLFKLTATSDVCFYSWAICTWPCYDDNDNNFCLQNSNATTMKDCRWKLTLQCFFFCFVFLFSANHVVTWEIQELTWLITQSDWWLWFAVNADSCMSLRKQPWWMKPQSRVNYVITDVSCRLLGKMRNAQCFAFCIYIKKKADLKK